MGHGLRDTQTMYATIDGREVGRWGGGEERDLPAIHIASRHTYLCSCPPCTVTWVTLRFWLAALVPGRQSCRCVYCGVVVPGVVVVVIVNS